MSAASQLSREDILSALEELNRLFAERDVIGELCLFGGAVMVLAFQARLSTKDVDAVFQPSPVVREAAGEVARRRNWPDGWLNDGVKGFLSAHHEVTAGPLPQFPNLRLTMPTPEYLLAMKCLASRLGAGAGEGDDLADIVFLIRHLRLPTPAAVMDLVTAYYPPDRVPAKAQFLVESLFAEGRV
jgi:hypothetical protein